MMLQWEDDGGMQATSFTLHLHVHCSHMRRWSLMRTLSIMSLSIMTQASRGSAEGGKACDG